MEQNNKIILLRQKTSEQGTEGIISLTHLGIHFFTLELPWHDNQPQISCIPTGIYEVALRKSPRFGITYHVKQVPDRSYILIHSGNFAGDISKGLKTNVEGCILLGMKRGTIAGQRAVLSSKVACRKFMNLMQGKEFILEIQGV